METLRVVANGLQIGAISADQYDSIQAEVKQDRKLYFAQILAYLGAVLRLFSRVMMLTPLMWFWLMATGLFSATIIDVETILSVLRTDPGVVISSVRFSLVLALMTTGIAVLLEGRVAAADVFDMAINKKICQTLGLPVNVNLVVIEDAVAPDAIRL